MQILRWARAPQVTRGNGREDRTRFLRPELSQRRDFAGDRTAHECTSSVLVQDLRPRERRADLCDLVVPDRRKLKRHRFGRLRKIEETRLVGHAVSLPVGAHSTHDAWCTGGPITVVCGGGHSIARWSVCEGLDPTGVCVRSKAGFSDKGLDLIHLSAVT